VGKRWVIVADAVANVVRFWHSCPFDSAQTSAIFDDRKPELEFVRAVDDTNRRELFEVGRVRT
jgi:hypothetical protein